MANGSELNAITEKIVGAAMEVHRALGPGLLESAYEACLAFELRERSLGVETQVSLPVIYKGVKLDCGYRLDLIVEGVVVVEVKAVEKLNSVHDAQLISYLKLGNWHVGLLLNFHSLVLKNGIRRLVNAFPDSATSAFSAVKLVARL
jgi:GxxExxY protein